MYSEWKTSVTEFDDELKSQLDILINVCGKLEERGEFLNVVADALSLIPLSDELEVREGLVKRLRILAGNMLADHVLTQDTIETMSDLMMSDATEEAEEDKDKEEDNDNG